MSDPLNFKLELVKCQLYEIQESSTCPFLKKKYLRLVFFFIHKEDGQNGPLADSDETYGKS